MLSNLILWFLHRFQYVRQLEQTIEILTAQSEEKRTVQAQEAVPKPRAFKLKLGWHEISQREAAKRNLKEQRIKRLREELERQ